MSNALSNIIPFPGVAIAEPNYCPQSPPPEKSVDALREVVWTLDRSDLTRMGIMMSRYTDDALHEDAETDFYERAKVAFAIYERILIEGDRLPTPAAVG